MSDAINVLGTAQQTCCIDPMTGFYRTGVCLTGPDDAGSHVICAEMTDEFLAFSQSRGNDLSAPAPHFAFPGLVAGDHWCLCAMRWREAYDAGVAPPPVVLTSTHRKALEFVPLDVLQRYALDPTF